MFDRFAKINIDFNAILKRVLEKHEADIIKLNQEQLLQGKRSDDSILPEYSPGYAKRMRKSILPKNLKLTGQFHEGLFATFFDKSFGVESDDYKSDILEKVWGKRIFGLTKENKLRLLDEFNVRNEVIQEVKNELKKAK